MSRVQVSRWILSVRLDRGRPASNQITSSNKQLNNMKVELIKVEGLVIGWSMEGENPEEIQKVCAIRDTQFFGFDQTAIVYSGRKGGDDKNPGVLSWKQRKHDTSAPKK